MPPLQTACSGGGAPFSCQTIDFLECSPVGNASVSAIATDGVPLAGVAATTDANGAFALCLPANEAFTTEITASGYPTTYFGELEGVSDDGIGQIPLIGQDEIGAITSLVPAGYDINAGLVIVKIDSTGPCDSSVAGWTLSLALPDGGSFPDGGYRIVYTGTSPIPDPSQSSTSSLGLAVIYNIDTSVSNFVVPLAQGPAGNTTCQPLNSQIGFTGRIYVAANSGSLYAILLP